MATCCFSFKQNTVSGMNTNESKVQVINYLVTEVHPVSLILKVNLSYGLFQII